MSDDLVSFLVLVRLQDKSAYPIFVRAVDPRGAYTAVIAQLSYLDAVQGFSVEIYVIGAEMLRDVVPETKQVAKAYWMAARDNEDFEAEWHANGPISEYEA